MKNLNEARIYVGSYGKYNSGNLCGAWLDLSDYSNKGEFYNACRELHKDENDPEFMFQDWENGRYLQKYIVLLKKYCQEILHLYQYCFEYRL